ncbi:MAG TPA: aminotransferase class I/II-fold pyridoxal phosphate-dependent enzyme [Anaerolineae bacterium]|nr:aminotransferase class I/II-fold pyridoxal phosphate-dependent enzyme [Anaerolineae bacterium]
MDYRRMPIEIESPEQLGYGAIRYNLTESSVSDARWDELGIDLSGLVLCYGSHTGLDALRELIAAQAGEVRPEDVLVTPGAAAALFIIHTALLKAGDRVLVEFPNYGSNLETPRAIGCQVDRLELRLEEGWRPDLARLEKQVQADTRLISLTHPHNPTGSTLSAGELEQAVRLAERRGCHLLVDETYREMNRQGVTPLAAALSEKAISVSSLSKAYGLPGIRIGWIITRDRALQELFLAAKEQMIIGNSVVDEEIALQVLRRRDELLPPIQKRSREAFGVVEQWMAGQAGLEWAEPTGGVVCFPRIREDSGVRVERFYQRLNEMGAFVGPGHWFEMDKTYMRIGYGWPGADELTGGLECIARALQDAAEQA